MNECVIESVVNEQEQRGGADARCTSHVTHARAHAHHSTVTQHSTGHTKQHLEEKDVGTLHHRVHDLCDV